MRVSLYSSARTRLTLALAVRTNGTVNGTTVDTVTGGTSFRAAMLIVLTGTMTDGTAAVKLQDSDDGSTWADVAADQVQGSAISIPSTGDDSVFEQGYLGSRRYLRAVVTTSGATSGGTLGAVILLGQAASSPVSHA